MLAGAAVWGLTATIAGAQTSAPDPEADGRVHTVLTLDARTVTVAFPPDLGAGDPAYRWLLADTVGARARVGTLDAHRALRLGTLAPDIPAIEAEIAAIVAERAAAAAADDADTGDADTGNARGDDRVDGAPAGRNAQADTDRTAADPETAQTRGADRGDASDHDADDRASNSDDDPERQDDARADQAESPAGNPAGADADAGAAEAPPGDTPADEAPVDEAPVDEAAADEAAADEAAADDTPPPPVLWLARNAEGWQLEIHPGGTAAGTAGAVVRTVPLRHRTTDAAAPTFAASLHATAAETGALALRWGRHAWSADFRFEELPSPPPRPRVSGRGDAREASDSNAAIARANTLSERNETALVLPDGARLAVLYWKGIDVEDEDYPTLAAARDGTVIEMIRAPVLRLRSDAALRFGDVRLETGNLAPGFAGVYGIWLRKAGDGWRFVFNHEADSWGTQHDPAFDVAEVAADYARTGGSFRPLGATLAPTGAAGGRLIVHWGPHEWAADFTVGE